MRAAGLFAIAALASCRAAPLAPTPAEPPPPAPIAPQPKAADPEARLRELCAADAKAFPPTESSFPREDRLEPEVAEAFAKRVRPLVPARLRGERLEVHHVDPVRGGHLVEAWAEDPKDVQSGSVGFLAFVPTAGAPRVVREESVMERADFDGDGKPEPLTRRCTTRPLYARECTWTAWFPEREVSFTRTLMRGSDLQVRTEGGRSLLRVVPADGVEPDFFPSEDLTVVRLAPSGPVAEEAPKLEARELAFAKHRYASEACDEDLRELDAARWERRIRLLGATDAEAPALAAHVLAKRRASTKASWRDPKAPITPRGFLDATFPESTEDDPIWDALPRPRAGSCPALPAETRDAWKREREAAVQARADARFADMVVPVAVTYGCMTGEGTLALVTWAEEAYFEPMATTELYVLRPNAPATSIASTRSQWVAEYHHIYDLELGPNVDLDGDGEEETVIVGTEYEVGTWGRTHVAAIWKRGALRQVPMTTFGRVRVAALDATRAAIVLTRGDDGKPWPPPVFILTNEGLRRAPAPAGWTTATKRARDAYAAARD
ncbi:MAG: hypothetical protein KIT84_07125 [Labilithrix sp.]|nr:hypothetical protein [Labilithrix sp.]MCW5810766.1 hypothetical protein [Labilithrix sp.]